METLLTIAKYINIYYLKKSEQLIFGDLRRILKLIVNEKLFQKLFLIASQMIEQSEAWPYPHLADWTKSNLVAYKKINQ